MMDSSKPGFQIGIRESKINVCVLESKLYSCRDIEDGSDCWKFMWPIVQSQVPHYAGDLHDGNYGIWGMAMKPDNTRQEWITIC